MGSRAAAPKVAVIGTGAIGSAVAWRLALRGAQVHAFDRWPVPHHRGASAGQTRRFATISMADPELTPLVQHAERLWHELAAASGRPLFQHTGGLIIGPENSGGIRSALANCQRWGLSHRLLDTGELSRRYPQHAVADGDVAIEDPTTGVLRPELAILAAVESARGRGAVLRDSGPVHAIHPDRTGVTIVTSQGRLRVDAAIVAPGAWAASLLTEPPFADIGRGLTARRLAQTWFAPAHADAYTAESFPVFERVGLPDSASLYGFPTQDGATVKIGVKTRPHPELTDPATPDPHLSDDHAREIAAAICRYLPGLHPHPVAVSMHVEGYTADSAPILGLLPEYPHVAVAAGFSGAGFKYATATGDALADLIIDGQTALPVQRWSPS